MAGFITNDPLADQPQATPAASGGFVTNDPVENNLQINDPNPPPIAAPSDQQSVVLTHAHGTLAGRILDGIGAGINSVIRPVYGDEPFGLSQETKNTLAKWGVFNDFKDKTWSPVKAFNEGVLLPLAAGLDVVNRTVQRVPQLATEVAGKIGEDLGLLEPGPGNTGDRFVRDTKTLMDSIAIVGGMEGHYFGTTQDADYAARYVAKEAPEPVGGPLSASVTAQQPKIAIGVDVSKSQYVDKAGNINLKNVIAPDDVKAVIMDQALEHAPDISNYGRGTVGFDEIARLSQDSGISAQTLIDRNIGQAYNAEQIYAARNLLVQSASDVKDLAQKAMATGSDADLTAFTTALDRHAMIQAQVSGVTAEAGRALAQFRIATKNGLNFNPILEDPLIRGDATKLAKAIASLETPQQVSKTIADVNKFTTLDKLQQVWMAGLLSNPATHSANVIGNTIMALWRVGETSLAGGIGTARQLFGGSATDRIFLGEGAAKLYGLVQGMPEGIMAAAKALITDRPSLGSKFETTLPAGGAIGGPVGRAVNLMGPTELIAEDEFFSTIAKRASLHAQAYSQASKEGLKGNAFFSRIGELTANPTEKMMQIAENEAQYDTFRHSLGSTGRKIQAIINENPWSKFIFPFVRTPINLLKSAAERTPLSIASKDVRDALIGLKGQAAQDEQIAKMAIGTSVLTAGLGLAAKGYLTGGGPNDPKERAALMATGWRPYSFKTDTGYSSYSRYEPISTMLGVIADAYEIGSKIGTPEAQDIGVLIAKSASQNVLSKTWLTGMASTLNAATDPQNSGPKWLKQMAGSFIPAGVAGVARVEDPYLRDVRNIIDSLKARIPGESATLPYKIDLFGNPIKRDSTLGPALLSPITESQTNADPILADMIKVRSFPAPIDRQIRGVQLDGKQYEELSIMSGKLSRFMLEQAYSSSGFMTLPDGVRKDIIDRIFTKTRELARNQMLLKHPDIIEQATKNKIETLQGKFK